MLRFELACGFLVSVFWDRNVLNIPFYLELLDKFFKSVIVRILAF